MLSPEQAPEDLLLHRALLSLVIGAGESLLLESIDPRALAPLGISAESLDAKIESLRITFDQWHTESKHEHREAILREVFGGET